MVGDAVSLEQVDVLGTKAGAAFDAGYHGGGMSLSACSDVGANKIRILDNVSFGVLVDGARAALGGENVDDTAEISRNLRGLWIQNASCPDAQKPCFMIHNGTLADNLGVGIGVVKESHGIIICRTRVTGTQSVTLPVFEAERPPGAPTSPTSSFDGGGAS